MFPGSPGASAVVLAVAQADLPVRGMGLIGRKARVECPLRIRECSLHLFSRLAGKEVTRYDRRHFSSNAREPLPRFGLAELSNLLLERIQPMNGLGIFLGSIKQRHELGVLLGRFGIESQELHQPTRSLDLGTLFLEHLPRAFPVWKDIGAIAQQTSAGGLQRAPDAHAQRWIVTWKIGDEEQPGWSSGWHCREYYLIVTRVTRVSPRVTGGPHEMGHP